MSRYVAIVDLPDPYYSHSTVGTGETVHEPEDVGKPQFSGLYNANGMPLYKLDDRQPIGFELRTVKR